MDQIKGYVERITFQNSDNGWTVARLKEAKKYDLTVIVGNMPSIQEGETLSCSGEWRNDPKFGMQFTVKDYKVERPSSVNGIKKYLGSGMIKGIGPVFAERIVQYYGENTLDLIDKKPDDLLKISGIGAKRIAKIKECWAEQKSIREVMVFLQSYGVSPTYAQKIFKQYGDASIWKMKDNPYHLARDIWGIGFKTADKIAQQLGIQKDSEMRIDAGVEYTLSELSNDGHTCYPVEAFLKIAAERLEATEERIQGRLEEIALEYRIVLSNLDIGKAEPEPYIWLQTFSVSEQGIAKELKRLMYGKTDFRTIDIPKAVDWGQVQMNIQLATNQQKAVAQSLTEKVQIITGGPGTGKSTITKVILAVMKRLTQKIILAAPTGRAAKRLGSITQMDAGTIHSILKFDFKINGFTHNRDNPLDCDFMIIDEASMIDTMLMYSLLKALPTHARLILVGDVDQLPSVGAGNVLNDFIESKQLPITQLTEIFRQAASSKIITNAHKINAGVFPNIQIDKSSDFFFIEQEDTEMIATLLSDLVATRLPKRYQLDRFEEIQVLSPMKRGVIGTNNLNTILQERLNPSEDKLSKAGRTYHPNDKVMQIRNNYDKEVFNGDVGRIQKINRADQEVEVLFDGRMVVYDFVDLDQLVLAYAVSVHKYQGSECKCIVMPIHTTHYNLLFRNLLYTGITRGKELVILVGTKKALGMAVRNNRVSRRHTGLQQALLQQMTKDGRNELYNKEVIKLKIK